MSPVCGWSTAEASAVAAAARVGWATLGGVGSVGVVVEGYAQLDLDSPAGDAYVFDDEA